MKILKISFDHINLFSDGISIDLTTSDRSSDRNQIYPLFKSISTQNVIGVVGPNASGKTTLLKLIRLAMSIVVMNKGLDDINVSDGIIKDNSQMTVYFYKDRAIYRLVSVIGLSDDANPEQRYFFKQEVISKKSESLVKNRAKLFEDGDFTFEIDRKSIEASVYNILKPQDSIVAAFASDDCICFDTLSTTNFNFFNKRSPSQMPWVNLFDDSIKSIESTEKDLTIEFKNSTEQLVCSNIFEAENYLSSGTIKGRHILQSIEIVLKKGGYLIIDEIENHLHKKLVQVIIGFFNDASINKNGATLIFSTHYSEIMDCIERKDNIYVLIRDKNYTSHVIRYSDRVSRNDIKKSDILISNYIEGTAPSYENILKAKELLWKLMN